MCLGMATVYVRYKQVEALTGEEELKRVRLNRFGLLLGLISSFGMCVVANFQVSAAALGSVPAVKCVKASSPKLENFSVPSLVKTCHTAFRWTGSQV